MLMQKLSRLMKGGSKDRRAIANDFDEEFYISKYSVFGDFEDPIEHYLAEGWRRGYDPCKWFSTSDYLRIHPDVAASGINPFVHYVRYGRDEGRAIRPIAEGSADQLGGSGLLQQTIDGPSLPADVLERHRKVVAEYFDVDFYRKMNPDLEALGSEQLVEHFNEFGWREWRDPCSWFSTAYYLTRYADIRDGGVNPFYHYITHGKSEGRLPTYYHNYKRLNCITPRVSVIIPNFNHSRFLEKRIASISAQTLVPHELIILDDASTDNSREVILELTKDLDFPVTLAFNEKNSGNVFRQWEKGVTLATGEVIWICESDDFCDENFLRELAPYFVDPSIMIAFGAIQFVDSEGGFLPGLDGYRESASAGYWRNRRVESASTWFKGPFGLRNVIPNVGGCLMRRQNIEKEIWAQAQSFAVCGDWYLYMVLARCGRIAFDPAAIAFFRQHQSNTSVSSFKKLSYYEEHFRIARLLRLNFGLDDAVSCKFYRIVQDHFLMHFSKEEKADFREQFDLNAVIDQSRERCHVLIVILGFFTGGGEIFPINLANGLVEKGLSVSVMVLSSDEENPEVRGRLDSRIPVFERRLVQEVGVEELIRTHQIDLINTHFVGADVELHLSIAREQIPYVVTHHGSYEVCEVGPEELTSILRVVNQWVYIADKNLATLKPLGLDLSKTTKLPNAVPKQHAAFPFDRKDLGIDDSAFVFGLASRALRSKGWEIAIKALEIVRSEWDHPVYLVICGEGPDYTELRDLHEKAEGVMFLGYQREIMAFYGLCDCCLLPTRFPGESFPLTIIEAILMGRPIIATDIGEISSMLHTQGPPAGIVVPNLDDDDAFVKAVAAAMRDVLDPEKRRGLIEGVSLVKERYDFDALIEKYISVFEKAGMKSAKR